MKQGQGLCSWILDSGTSIHLTGTLSDFVFYEEGDYGLCQTTSGIEKLRNKGMVIIRHNIKHQGNVLVYTLRLEPVSFMKAAKDMRLIFLGQFMQEGFLLHDNKEQINILNRGKIILQALPHTPGNTIFWCDTYLICHDSHIATVAQPLYTTWHNRLGHPGNEVLSCMKDQVKGLPKIEISKNTPICKGCAEGKMHEKSFPPLQS